MTGKKNKKKHYFLISGMLFVLAALFLINSLLSKEKLHIASALSFEIPGIGLGQNNFFEKIKNQLEEEEGEEEEPFFWPEVDFSDWKSYRNQWYGFELKYPKDWEEAAFEKAQGGYKWEYRYLFRKKSEDRKDASILGFKVTVYNTGNAKELRDTEEFPKRKSDSDSKEESLCEDIQDYLTKSPDYPAEEIYIPSGDHCYEAGLFYSLQRGNYRYNISPIYTEEYAASNNLKKQTAEIFGEFFTVALNFRLIDISRPKPKPKLKPKPKTPSAPMPVSAKKSNGKLICAKKNDKPRKSKQNKGKHMDMECCLDPDEYPNPHCTY